MNNEIKEILDYLKEFIDEDRLEQINLNRWFVSSLLDYITNLQQENKEYKEYVKELRASLRNYHIKNNKLINKNERIDKAIEYIDSLWLDKDGLVLNIRERLHFILRGKDNE